MNIIIYVISTISLCVVVVSTLFLFRIAKIEERMDDLEKILRQIEHSQDNKERD